MQLEQIKGYEKLTFAIFATASLGSFLLAHVLELTFLFLLPVLLLMVLLAIMDFRSIYYMLFFTLPLSTEFDLGGGFGTDLPSEPFMVGLMLIGIPFLLSKQNTLDFSFFKQPLTIMLGLHFFWMLYCVFWAENQLVSSKFVLAKLWYIVTFFLLGAAIIKEEKDFKPIFWALFWPMLFTIVVIMYKHGTRYAFSFENVNINVYPFYRNHVSYAAMITIFYPFLFVAASWYKKGTWQKRLLNLSKILYLFAIYFSFTRACYLALAVAAIAYIIVRLNLMKYALLAAMLAAGLFVSYLLHENNYIKYAPEYQKTIYHTDFGQHIQATYELKDVSSMERLYRWVASAFMSVERPYVGYGPGNFYPYYKRYTVHEFVTYTSDNEEQSTAHNYFLLVLVEQGYIGLGIFILFTLVLFMSGQWAYKNSINKDQRNFIMALVLAEVILFTNLMLSDLVETDKTGSFFFLCMGLLAMQIVRIKKHKTEVAEK
ncbi:MAG: O-antigen ligase family protein [Chitinophagales bacterium]